MAKQLLTSTSAALFCSLNFALHPVHTEAVTGVVGRAELLSAAVSLTIFLLYRRVVFWPRLTACLGLFVLGFLLALGTLCKEQCITVVGVLAGQEFISLYRSFIQTNYKSAQTEATSVSKKRSHATRDPAPAPLLINGLRFRAAMNQGIRSPPLQGLVVMACFAVCIMLFRIRIMGSQLPHFTEFDNPAAHAEPLSRRLTHLYLIPVNIWLLLCPSGLCADWTLGSVPLVMTWSDSRNLATMVTFMCLALMTLVGLHPQTPAAVSRTVIIALSWLVFPFLPASNLFFSVGFVVAERVLYTPSVGWSLLVGLGYDLTCPHFHVKKRHVTGDRSKRNYPRFMAFLFCSILVAFSLKTFRRNFDWKDEYALFNSALKVNPTNAKMWNNVGHTFESDGRYEMALGYFQKAVQVQPNDIGARINVGRTFANLKQLDDAENAYMSALDYFPKPRKGQVYYARVAPKDLMVFINLANLYLNKTPSQLDDASRVLRRAISLRSDFVDAYQNYGSVLIKQGKLNEAEETYRTALNYEQRNPDLYYNPALFALASTLSDSIIPEEKHRAKKLLEQLVLLQFEMAKVHFSLGMLETDLHNYAEAARHYRVTIMHEPEHRSGLFNLALIYRNHLNQSTEAEPLLYQLIKFHPDHVKSFLLLGDIELTERKRPMRAKELFAKAVRLAPTSVQAKHNFCVALAENAEFEESEQCLIEAIQMAPGERYLRDHLSVVRRQKQASIERIP